MKEQYKICVVWRSEIHKSNVSDCTCPDSGRSVFCSVSQTPTQEQREQPKVHAW